MLFYSLRRKIRWLKEEEKPKYNLNNEACSNLKCTLHGKTGEGNIVRNGTIKSRHGEIRCKFLCKVCGTSFCSRTGTRRVDPEDPSLLPVRSCDMDKWLKRGMRQEIIAVSKRSVYGDVPLDMISTAFIERHNLNLRHENRRLTRKTIAFSKKTEGLTAQMTVYQSYFNFVHPHGGLFTTIPKPDSTLRQWQNITPAMDASITD